LKKQSKKKWMRDFVVVMMRCRMNGAKTNNKTDKISEKKKRTK
jgi:hypothetical protein